MLLNLVMISWICIKITGNKSKNHQRNTIKNHNGISSHLLLPIRIATIKKKKKKITNFGEDVKQLEPLGTIGIIVNGATAIERFLSFF